jgi:hypothetical protein
VSVAVDHARPAVRRGEACADIAVERDGSTRDRPNRLKLGQVRTSEWPFTRLLSSAANSASVNPRALADRTLLHLPRVATRDGWVTTGQIEKELFRSARLLSSDTQAVEHLLPDRKFALDALTFVEDFDPVTSYKLFSSLHYLRSARLGSRNFALVDPVKGRPVTICSVSPFEWVSVGNHIRNEFDIPQEKILDVSRVYSSDVAPYNAISSLLSRVRRSLRSTADLLITAVDPNLGFQGSSYHAAGWQRWLTVQPRPYFYHNGQYASTRQLRRLFGTSNLDELKASYPGQRFEQSRARLLDSLIFCCRVKRQTEAIKLSDKCPLRR